MPSLHLERGPGVRGSSSFDTGNASDTGNATDTPDTTTTVTQNGDGICEANETGSDCDGVAGTLDGDLRPSTSSVVLDAGDDSAPDLQDVTTSTETPGSTERSTWEPTSCRPDG